MKKVYSIEGIDCANCAAKIEDKINRIKSLQKKYQKILFF